MSAIRTDFQRILLAELFKNSFASGSDYTYYTFIGKTSDWADESTPDTPTSSFYMNQQAHWSDMLGGEIIGENNVAHVIPRVDWTSGEVYDIFDDQDTSLFSKTFYVMNSTYDVYKCINNNNDGASTTEPTGQSTSNLTTADGYVWKYMFTLSPAFIDTFLSNSWIPVTTLTSDDGSDQWDVQAAAVDGSIDHIVITDGGAGYDSAPTITIVGDGTGATATATLDGDAVGEITVTAAGSGYTYATIQISGGTPDTDATARGVISPKGGHGSDPVKELGAYNVMIVTELSQDESGTLPTSNDFRKIGIVKNPLEYGTDTVASASNFIQTTRLTINSGYTGTFTEDEVVTGGTSGAVGVVVSFDSVNRYLYVTEISDGVFETSETVTTSGGSGTVTAVGTPDFEPGSGAIIYIDHRGAVTRDPNQLEKIKTVMVF